MKFNTIKMVFEDVDETSAKVSLEFDPEPPDNKDEIDRKSTRLNSSH